MLSATILFVNKKKVTVIVLLIALPIATGLSTYFITHAIERKKADEEKRELAIRLFETHYNDRCKLFEQENATIKNIDVAFLGDSLTEGYDLKSFYPQWKVVNRGIGGDTTIGLEKRLNVSAYDANPKVISMLIGANNFDTMLNNYETIVEKLKQNLPQSSVILCSLTSMTGDWAKNNVKAKQNNIEIQKLATKYGYVYADLYNPLLDPNTNELNEVYSVDGGHLTKDGYTVITNTLTPLIENLLK